MFFAPPPLNISRGGGGQKKYVLYSTMKKLTLPTGYSVSQHIWYELRKTGWTTAPPPLQEVALSPSPPLVARLVQSLYLFCSVSAENLIFAILKMLANISEGALIIADENSSCLDYTVNEDGSCLCKLCGELTQSRTHWYRHKYKVNTLV